MKIKIIIIFIILSLCICPTYANEEVDTDEVTITEDPDKIDKAGTYFVKIETTEDQELYKIIRMHVTFPKTVIATTNQEGIDAHDVKIEKNRIDTITNSEMIDLAGAHAWSLLDGSEILITDVTITKMGKQGIDYQVTFATEKGTKTTINAYTGQTNNLSFTNLYVHRKEEDRRINSWVITFIGVVLLLIPGMLLFLLYFCFYKKLYIIREFLYKE